MYDVGKEFFHQPMAEKIHFDLGKGYGYGGYLHSMETASGLSDANANKSDGVESLSLRGLNHLSSSQVCGATRLHFAQAGAEMPHADPVPCSPASLLPSVIRLHAAVFDFKIAMMAITELALGATPGDFNNSIFYPEKGGLRLAYYPEMSEDPVGDALDYGAHADTAPMAFLRLDRDNPAGTQVLHKQKWLPVPSIPGSIVVNLGKVFSKLTGGRWKAAMHRATRTTRKERMSIVLSALTPRNDLMLECLPQVCGVESSEPHKISVKEYFDARVRLQRPDNPQRSEDYNLVSLVDQAVTV
eukprot:gnl/MRDRNA2_/MRDRNA2_212559_c0_seq1.p1 gnl/MRDRNA2_/MRDRNA2_212559_c0~~gnl/MRDRNA2_/MRDRNA2_212559_c0_seq1.p1  ORF type:complete len:338 (+),score=34.14 gnl/MRDRNA2_/MRDRNA2_212559_c0_seq1:115-1014(+)